MKLGMLVSRVRMDEKMLLEAADKRGVTLTPVDDRDLTYDIAHGATQYDQHGARAGVITRGSFDALLERSISYWHSYYATRALERYGVPVVNQHNVIRRCGDKAETSWLLSEAGVATPRVIMAMDEESALRACDDMGYPCVLKPVVGSWGRLIAKADSHDVAQALIEHKTVLGGPQHSVIYVQEYVEKPGRDLRAFVVGDEVVAAIYRTNPKHFITNTAQGGTASNCPVTPAIEEISLKAAEALGGGILAMDLMETPDGSLTCHEVNHTMEFKNSVAPTGVDIPGKIIEHLIEVGKGRV